MLFSGVLVLLSSCEFNTKVELDIPEPESKLSVIAYLETGGNSAVFVSPVSDVFDPNTVKELDNVIVSLFQQGSFLCNLEPIGNNNYYALSPNCYLNSGDSYSLMAIADDFEEVQSGETRIPEKIYIDTIELKDSTNNYLLFEFSFQDNTLEENYYAKKIEKYYQGNLLVDSNYLEPLIDPALAFSDIHFNGEEHKATLETYALESFEGEQVRVDEVKVILFSLSRELFEFFNTIDNLEGTFSDPILESDIIFSNLENGYGIVGGFAADTITLHL